MVRTCKTSTVLLSPVVFGQRFIVKIKKKLNKYTQFSVALPTSINLIQRILTDSPIGCFHIDSKSREVSNQNKPSKPYPIANLTPNTLLNHNISLLSTDISFLSHNAKYI